MAEPTLVNGQITDAVTQSEVMVLGSAPSMAIGALYQVTAQAIALSMQNAVANQQAMNSLASVILARCVQAIDGTD
jgi:hypothetical protein